MTDSDNGNYPLIKGTCADSKGSFVDKCSSSVYELMEYSCFANNTLPLSCISQTAKCPIGTYCNDGACVNNLGTTICLDSDGGSVRNVKGTIKGYDSSDHTKYIDSVDYCSADGKVIYEYVCNSQGYVVLNSYGCSGTNNPNGCVDGTCNV